MKVVVAGTGYVGLITGVVLAYIGNKVVCIDVDQEKIKLLRQGKSSIYEKDLDKYLLLAKDNLTFTTDNSCYKDSDVIIIGVGTPERQDGSANLDYVYDVCNNIIKYANKDMVVVIKSTVPIGTNDEVEEYLSSKRKDIKLTVVSNPEFLSQGSAIHDTLYASRIIVGAVDDNAFKVMRELYEPLLKEPYNVPYLEMNRRSAEMVKYASNDFLALKISYINEIANLCNKVGANIDEVTKGMSYDKRIGSLFLKPGIGYGGSCFPKDTKALHWLSKINDCELTLVKACIEINKKQKLILFNKLREDFNYSLKGKKITILGLTFKPMTDDLREAPSLVNIDMLLDYDADITVYDPIALDKVKKIYNNKIKYANTIDEAIKNSDAVLIMTEWAEIKNYNIDNYTKYMKYANIYDGRNCYDPVIMKNKGINYYSIGR